LCIRCSRKNRFACRTTSVLFFRRAIGRGVVTAATLVRFNEKPHAMGRSGARLELKRSRIDGPVPRDFRGQPGVSIVGSRVHHDRETAASAFAAAVFVARPSASDDFSARPSLRASSTRHEWLESEDVAQRRGRSISRQRADKRGFPRRLCRTWRLDRVMSLAA